MRTRAIVILVVISLLWGSGWAFAPLLEQTAAPFAASALLYGLASGVLLLPWLRSSDRATHVRWQANLLLAVSMLAAPSMLILLADRYGAAGWVPLTYALLPLLVAFPDGAWSVAMVAPVGAVLVLLNGTVPFTPQKILWASPVLAAVLLQAFALRYAARHMAGMQLGSLLRSTAIQCALAAALLTAGSTVFDRSPRLAPPSQWSLPSAGAYLLLAAAGTALPYLLFYRLLARQVLAPRHVATTQWLQTLITVAEGLSIARGRPALPMLFAGAVIVLCTAMVLREPGSACDVQVAPPGTR